MTANEKQEIVNAVLSALKTNSLDILDLTEVSSLPDDAYIEVSGGRRILASRLVEAGVEVIEERLNGIFDYQGVATPSTEPGTPDHNVFYLAGAGTYANFGDIHVVPGGSLGVFSYNGTWTFEAISIVADSDAVLYSAQRKTNSEKIQARANIGLGDGTIDTTPTAGSANLVTSGGVSKALNIFDKTKTYFTIQTSNTGIDLRTIWSNTNIKNETPGTCSVNWGDGTPTVSVVNDDSFRHTYAQAGIYTITVTGLTGLTSNLLFRENTLLKSAKFGNTFVNPSTYFMLNSCPNCTDVEFFAENPLTWNFGTSYGGGNMNLVSKIIVPRDSLLSYLRAWYFDAPSLNKDWLTKRIVPDEPVGYCYKPITVTVGQLGDFTSLNDAIQSLSTSYPVYQSGGLKAIIKILSGTTIAEQVYVDGLDLSWITIQYEDYNPSSLNYDNVAEDIANGTIVFDETTGYNSVSVDASNFSYVTHDSRSDVCLFRAENGARLPIIECVFKLTTPQLENKPVCGILCNRGSEAVVKTLCGFIGFNDGVISNNESSITIREGITMNCSRWGCHARHNGEVSARSVIATGCATNTYYSLEYGAAVADRVADMDVREAYLSGNVAIRCNNASTICARGTHILGGGVANAYMVEAQYSGRINASNMTFANLVTGTKMFSVRYGGWIDAFSVTNKTYNVVALNSLTSDGVIFG